MKLSRLFLKWRPKVDVCCGPFGYQKWQHINVSTLNLMNLCFDTSLSDILGMFSACCADIRILNISSVALK